MNMQAIKRFIFMASQDTFDLSNRFFDLQRDDRVTYIEGSGRKIENPILLLLRNIHLSTRINRYIQLPFKSIWGCNLNKIDWKKDITYYLIIVQGALWPIKPSYIEKLKEEYHIKLVILLFDSFDSDFAKRAKYYISKLNFDYIFSFDRKDCEKYGFEFLTEEYSKKEIENHCDKKYDIYFIGINKNRIAMLHEVYKDMMNNGATGVFRISDVPKKNQTFNGIIYNKYIKYDDMLTEVLHANCIFELLSEGQTGATLRYYEAVCYNKKLLTNNKNVVNLPFYNPDYIHVFERLEDIDWEWVKERVPIDYHYDGRFSPTHLIDKIIEIEEEKERNELGKGQIE